MSKVGWKLKEWNARYGNVSLPIMSTEEIETAISYLRDNNYPKPDDCLEIECPVHRPACTLGVCHIAVGMCGDF